MTELASARHDALAWWQRLEEEAGAGSGIGPDEIDQRLRPRWPCGPASHPRVIAVYQKYYHLVVDYNERATAEAADRDSADSSNQDGWGVDDTDTSEGFEDYELQPVDLLIERLEWDAPELDEFMKEFLMLPGETKLKKDGQRRTPSSPPAKFSFPIIHRVERGIDRLMSAPRDLPPTGHWRDPPLPLAEASAEHRALFATYASDLEAALGHAEEWWNGVVKRAKSGSFRRQSNVQAAYDTFFAGPAGHLQLQWVLHHYWLECVKLNEQLDEDLRVPCEVLMLHWLLDGRHDSWIDALTCLPYWPIGLDDEGNWV
ncbi:MAG: hypothetical protein ACYTG0_28800 [Planctomycetota bacterium]